MKDQSSLAMPWRNYRSQAAVSEVFGIIARPPKCHPAVPTPPLCYLCKNPTHADLPSDKRLCQRLRQGLVRLLNSAFGCSWSCPVRSSLGFDAAQTPNLNVLNTLSTLDCSLSCSKCLLFFPVWVQLKLQDICQTGWDSSTTLSIPLHYCEEWSIK